MGRAASTALWYTTGGWDRSDALVMQVQLVGSPDDADKMLHEILVPKAQAQPGFQSGTWLHDGTGKGMALIVFATGEEAEAAKAALTPPVGPKRVSANVWIVAAEA